LYQQRRPAGQGKKYKTMTQIMTRPNSVANWGIEKTGIRFGCADGVPMETEFFIVRAEGCPREDEGGGWFDVFVPFGQTFEATFGSKIVKGVSTPEGPVIESETGTE
jgi:hypothetical protein